MANPWVGEARRRLIGLARGGSWGYRPGSTPAIEPTSLAALALLATEGDGPPAATDTGGAAASRAAAWLATVRNRDGSLGVTPSLPSPGWPTPLPLLLWSNLGGFEAPRAAAVRWLLATRGATFTKAADDPVGHDGTLVGWPWVESTHSWVEPTASAILALAREGRGEDRRVLEGIRVLRDRAIASGGWNLGNPIVFRTSLRPFPAPSGLALLALKAAGARSDAVPGAIAYLDRALPETLAPGSLGWGLLGLRAWGPQPGWAAGHLAEAYAWIESRVPSAAELALLLLAAGSRSMAVLGCSDRAGTKKDEAADA